MRYFIMALAVLLSLAPNCIACQCGSIPDTTTARKDAAAVFQGRVVSVHDSYGVKRKLLDLVEGVGPASVDPEAYYLNYGFRVRFEVSKVWKGAASKTIEVVTGRGGGDCGFAFVTGSDYLVFAFAHATALGTGICSRTRTLSSAAADIAVLGPPTGIP